MSQGSTLILYRSLLSFSRTAAADTSSVTAFLASYKRRKKAAVYLVEQQPFLVLQFVKEVLQTLPTVAIKKPRTRTPKQRTRITKSRTLPAQRPAKQNTLWKQKYGPALELLPAT